MGRGMMVLLTVLVATGVLLSMGYSPAVDEAYRNCRVHHSSADLGLVRSRTSLLVGRTHGRDAFPARLPPFNVGWLQITARGHVADWCGAGGAGPDHVVARICAAVGSTRLLCFAGAAGGDAERAGRG